MEGPEKQDAVEQPVSIKPDTWTQKLRVTLIPPIDNRIYTPEEIIRRRAGIFKSGVGKQNYILVPSKYGALGALVFGKKKKKTVLITDDYRTRYAQRKATVGQKIVRFAEKETHFLGNEPIEDSALSKALGGWSYVTILPLTFEVWAIPYRLAFGNPGFNYLLWMDVALDAFFVLDGFIAMNVPVIDVGNLVLQTRRELAQLYFSTTFRNEFVPCMLRYAIWSEEHVELWWALSMARLTRLLRIVRFFRAQESKLDANVKMLQVYKFLFMIFLVGHWLGCMFFWLARLQDFDSSTWVRQFSNYVMPEFDFDNSSQRERYVVALYKGLNMLSSLQYDSTFPSNTAEQMFSTIAICVQVVMEAYILGTLFHYLISHDDLAEEFQSKQLLLENYMAARALPTHLRKRIALYFQYQHEKRMENAAADISLPHSLAVKVANHKFMDSLNKNTVKGELFSGCTPQFLNAIVVKLREVYLMPGEELMRKGDISRELSFVTSGQMEVKHLNMLVKMVRPDVAGDPGVVGELSFFLGLLQPYTVRVPDFLSSLRFLEVRVC
ncbi:hypothetical protein CYMTET_50659 [Cymbomonas tetramitiformis]|uniref:Cyclic nucleotide-binding domain-containing protein n=1 Tax=Cymbomonas tetramitiformis TaxID=36881 RepID=A0AAE0BMR7_9CHLO|nr:hypothetical protein CYMTET_50659 [Cymbomonas tetramitiformis]